ncbi:S9 family peptidase [Parasphingorhabdus flavimaris]|uniref:S9 family peptidase n=1 Tax=Parasphingorhabdus flavimaris TaxID=266812 RepID=A0ABX2N664_9SPHN|nr:S9 family peptidase [Parasphingorhabdus flavimaris]NVD29127.1 S9 family peptidase [Parasphingorhabdus flavimaris]
MTKKLTRPPFAEQRPHSYKRHGYVVNDPWHWLKDARYPVVEDEDVLAYLKAENQWFEQNMADRKPLIQSLFQEMKARIKEDDSSVPQKDGDWLYWAKFEEGMQYRQHWRKAVSGGEDQLMLDENVLAEGKEYFRLGAASVSPDGRLLAYAYDDNGSERFEARIKDLSSGELLPDIIPGTLSSLVWSADSKMLLYGLANEQWRTDNARIHVLGTDIIDDVELYHEDDEGFRVGIGLTHSEKYITISTGDHETSEVRLVPTDNPLAKPILVSARKVGREYEVEEHDDMLYILTNDEHVNFRLATAPIADPDNWKTLIAGSDEFYLTDVCTFKDFYVTEGRENGLDQIEIRSYGDPGKVGRIAFPEASYSAGLDDNPEYDVDKLRLSYDSMVTPSTAFDYHLDNQSLETLKVQEIPSGYDASQYVTERLMIEVRDGTVVPVSLVYRKDSKIDGSAPLHLYSYGAYGYAVPPSFSTTRLSLVDRGFVYAIAHIRGGDDLGRNWYLDGKLTKRTNTFNDFVDVARGLIAKGYTSEGRITASGGSAGGELMGAIVNSDPELWGAIVAHVPFVDVLNTMQDESLPLTPGEWPEWGNPITDKTAFEYIRSYSPYDQVSAQAYPPMLITGGLNDPRVTYWEPAKWTARLRATKTDDNILLLKTNMGAGHGGKSGRWNALEETAEEFAFILWQMGMAE